MEISWVGDIIGRDGAEFLSNHQERIEECRNNFPIGSHYELGNPRNNKDGYVGLYFHDPTGKESELR